MAFRRDWQAREPGWFNGAVSSVGGGEEARLLILGLAPGLRGANRTGIPFTGDASGAMLFMALARTGFAEGAPGPDGIPDLHEAMITNVVRCVPPQNRPAAAEIAACRPFLAARLAALPRLRAVLCLGGVAHAALTDALGARRRDHAFAHGARHEIGGLRGVRQLPLLAAQHEYRTADRRDARRGDGLPPPGARRTWRDRVGLRLHSRPAGTVGCRRPKRTLARFMCPIP